MTDNEHGDAATITYADAGVDIQSGQDLVADIGSMVKKTQRPELLSGIGGFGAAFAVPPGYKEPVLVSCTDGVGTKLKLAIESNCHAGIGIDLVAMCVNDLLCMGAEPLFFLDYYATAKLDRKVANAVIAGMVTGCEQSGMSLVGGETAELPGLYREGDYDCAGFCVGVVERAALEKQRTAVQVGDQLIALPASGLHSNGYSLVRKVIAKQQVDLQTTFISQNVNSSKSQKSSKIQKSTKNIDNKTLLQHLLSPTKIYVQEVQACRKKINIHGVAHITGGGLIENAPRMCRENQKVCINKSSWQRPEIFNWLQKTGPIAEDEMWRTFNMGVGMLVAVAAEDVEATIAAFAQENMNAWHCGAVVAGAGDPSLEWA